MLFIIKNEYFQDIDRLRTDTLMDAYFAIKHFPLKASDKAMDAFIKAKYNTSLKNMCINLLLSLSFYKNEKNELVLLFKNPKHDAIARLITYGNGAIPGSKILQRSIR